MVWRCCPSERGQYYDGMYGLVVCACSVPCRKRLEKTLEYSEAVHDLIIDFKKAYG